MTAKKFKQHRTDEGIIRFDPSCLWASRSSSLNGPVRICWRANGSRYETEAKHVLTVNTLAEAVAKTDDFLGKWAIVGAAGVGFMLFSTQY